MTEMIIVLGSLLVLLGWLRAIEGRLRVRPQDPSQSRSKRSPS